MMTQSRSLEQSSSYQSVPIALGDDARRYMPTNLPQEFQKDGLRIGFEAKELPDQSRVYYWGTVVELVIIQKL